MERCKSCRRRRSRRAGELFPLLFKEGCRRRRRGGCSFDHRLWNTTPAAPQPPLGEEGKRKGPASAYQATQRFAGRSLIPAAIAVWALAKPPVFAAYLGFAVVGAFTMGLGFAYL